MPIFLDTAAADTAAAVAADGADGEAGRGEAGAAVVDVQVDAGDSEACTDIEALDPGVLGATTGSTLGSGDAMAADAAASTANSALSATGRGEGGARNSSSAMRIRSRGTLSCSEGSEEMRKEDGWEG